MAQFSGRERVDMYVSEHQKSPLIAFFLSLLFGPVGYLYVSAVGGAAFILISIGLASIGGLAFAFIIWIFCIFLAPFTAVAENGKIRSKAELMVPEPSSAEASGETRKCPYCAELIRVEAKVCRYCGHEILPTVNKEIDPPKTLYIRYLSPCKKIESEDAIIAHRIVDNDGRLMIEAYRQGDKSNLLQFPIDRILELTDESSGTPAPDIQAYVDSLLDEKA